MFVILAARRSGTHMLASLLSSHPDLRCYDEILLPPQPRLKLGWKDITKLDKNEGCIVTYRRFAMAPPEIKNLIQKQKIIHLMRRNLYKQAQSIEAMSPPDRRHDLKWRQEEIIRNKNKVFDGKRQFKNVFDLFYEDICHDKSIESYENPELLKYLEVKPIKLTTNLIKGVDPK